MKQPELGHQISKERKTKGYTQSELAEKCNVDIRTIQRIETGEVTPRLFTLRIINEKLATNYELNGDYGDEWNNISSITLRSGWIAGIVLTCLTPIMFFEAFHVPKLNKIGSTLLPFLLLVYISIHVISTVFFYRSLFQYGKTSKNTILTIGSIATIIVVGIYSVLKIVGSFADLSFLIYTNIIFGGLFGVTTVIVGIGFLLERIHFRNLAISIGVTQLLAGTFYAFAGILGIGLGAVSLILQIIFLIRIEGLVKV